MAAVIWVSLARAKSAVRRLFRRAGWRGVGAWVSMAAMAILLGHGLLHPSLDENGEHGPCSRADCALRNIPKHEQVPKPETPCDSCCRSAFEPASDTALGFAWDRHHDASAVPGAFAHATSATLDEEGECDAPSLSHEAASSASPCPLCFLLHGGGWKKTVADDSAFIGSVVERTASVLDAPLPARPSFDAASPRGPPRTLLS